MLHCSSFVFFHFSFLSIFLLFLVSLLFLVVPFLSFLSYSFFFFTFFFNYFALSVFFPSFFSIYFFNLFFPSPSNLPVICIFTRRKFLWSRVIFSFPRHYHLSSFSSSIALPSFLPALSSSSSCCCRIHYYFPSSFLFPDCLPAGPLSASLSRPLMSSIQSQPSPPFSWVVSLCTSLPLVSTLLPFPTYPLLHYWLPTVPPVLCAFLRDVPSHNKQLWGLEGNCREFTASTLVTAQREVFTGPRAASGSGRVGRRLRMRSG